MHEAVMQISTLKFKKNMEEHEPALLYAPLLQVTQRRMLGPPLVVLISLCVAPHRLTLKSR